MTVTFQAACRKIGAGALGLSLLCAAGLSHAAPPKRTAKKTAAAPSKTTPANAARIADYVVAVVNSEPVTNHEVNVQAQQMAAQLASNGQKIPPREALLAQALNEIILQKGAIQSVRETTLAISEEEFDSAEKSLAQQRNLSPADFRKGVMAERRISENEYRKDLTDQLLLRKMREMRSSMAAEKVTELDAIQWLREQKGGTATVVENHARHILLRADKGVTEAQGKTQLAAVRQRIATGKLDFAAAARQLSHDASAAQGGDLGWAPVGAFVPEFEEQVAALKPGQMSQPFASRFGVHLVQLIDRRSTPMTPEQQVQAARNILRQKKAQEALAKWEKEVRAQVYVEMRGAPR